MIIRILYYYYKSLLLTRLLRHKKYLIAYQNRCFKKLVRNTLIHSPFYKEYLNKPFNEWPISNKQIMMQHFDTINTLGIKKEEALALALKAEQTRDFSPLIKGVAVGLSSGTSGDRGLFLVNSRERDAWAGIILAKILPHGFKTKERVAFFLRANSPLYTNVSRSKKIQFSFFDLLGNFEEHIARLNQLKPTILSAPSSVLLALAQCASQLDIQPKRIFAVAEVLEPSDAAFISKAFGVQVSQVYQCTEGFLAVSSKKTNSLVMNDEFLIIEKEWLDEERFIPIITDLQRRTQPIIRYRLDDVLVIKKTQSAFTELSEIQGRLGDVCYGAKGQELVPIFADVLRQRMASSPIVFDDYRICQNNVNEFTIQITPEVEHKEDLIPHLNALFQHMDCSIPNWIWQAYEPKPLDMKRRRIQSRLRNAVASLT